MPFPGLCPQALNRVAKIVATSIGGLIFHWFRDFHKKLRTNREGNVDRLENLVLINDDNVACITLIN
jgi:hypothetical protein